MTSRGTSRRRSRSSKARLPAFLLAVVLVSGCGGEKKPKPAAANDRAGLVFTRHSGQFPGVWLADADGSNERQIVANGSEGSLSPDGRQVTYSIPNGGEHWLTNIKNVEIGDPRSLGEVTVLDWSPDSKRLVVRDPKRLLLVDADSGATRELASGVIRGASFSPDGTAVAFSRANNRKTPNWRSDIFVIRVSDDSVARLTKDGRSDEPLWRSEWIAFRRVHAGDRPALLFLMHPDGNDVQRLTTGNETPSPRSLGFLALGYSEDGTKLLACAATEHCSPVTFSVPDGEAHHLSVETEAVTVPQDLSKDGAQVLATGGALDSPRRNLYTIPFEGGGPQLLLKNVSSARWAG